MVSMLGYESPDIYIHVTQYTEGVSMNKTQKYLMLFALTITSAIHANDHSATGGDPEDYYYTENKEVPKILDYDTRDLFDGIKKQNIVKVTNAVRQGAKLEAKNDEDKTPLYAATEIGDLSIVALLLSQGANVETTSTMFKRTALHIAAYNNKVNIIKLLLLFDAPINAINAYNVTPLKGAVHKEHEEVIKILLEAGADTRIVDVDGESALAMAHTKKNTKLVRLLSTHIGNDLSEYRSNDTEAEIIEVA